MTVIEYVAGPCRATYRRAGTLAPYSDSHVICSTTRGEGKLAVKRSCLPSNCSHSAKQGADSENTTMAINAARLISCNLMRSESAPPTDAVDRFQCSIAI